MRGPRLSRAASGARAAYTLLEMLAAIAALAVILTLLFSTTGMTAMAWRDNASAAGSFQQARSAFGVMTQHLGRATLNSYRDYFDVSSRQFAYPVLDPAKTEYRFRSELHFVSGPAGSLIGEEGKVRPTDAVFFQAPLGRAQGADGSMRSLLNVCGFYVEFGDDAAQRPVFMAKAAPRLRHRLYEAIEPSELVDIYQYPIGSRWLKNFVSGPLASSSHMLAENVVALVLLPQRYEDDTALAPRYAYDSRAWQAGQTTVGDLTQNQLPPLLQVTMVVIDEKSAAQLEAKGGDALEKLVDPALFSDATGYASDLRKLEASLKDCCRYRVFQTTVALTSTVSGQ